MQASMIRQAMEQAGGNVQLAAQTLGISRATLYRKLGHKD
jgi:transcriptional regulator of acetoin/glycerol metabolism